MFGFDPVQLLDGLLKQSLTVVALVRGPDHRLVFANLNFRALANRPVEMGRPIAEFISPYAVDGRVPALDRVRERNQREELRQLVMPPMRNERGPSCWNCDLIPVSAIEDADAGILIIAHDITEEHLAAKKCEEQAALLDAIMRYAPIGLVITDRDAMVRRVSRYFVEMAGQSQEELETKIDREYVRKSGLCRADGSLYTHPDQLPMCRATRSESLVHEQLMRTRPDGTTVIYNCHAAPVHGPNGDIIGAIGALDDITPLKALEEELRDALKAKELLLNELSHRVKNNLQVAASFLNLQLVKSQHEEVRAALLEAAGRIRALAGMHRRLYGRREFDGRVDFAESLKDLAEDVAANSESEIPIRVSAELALHLDADIATPLLLLTHELLVNAYKHAFPEKRRGTIRVSLTCRNHGGILTVADDGIGVAEEIKQEPGLGMSLIRGLARQANASLHLRTSPDKGTRVTISFPLTPSKIAPTR